MSDSIVGVIKDIATLESKMRQLENTVAAMEGLLNQHHSYILALSDQIQKRMTEFMRSHSNRDILNGKSEKRKERNLC